MTKEKGRVGLLVSTLCILLTLSIAPAAVGAAEYVPPTNEPNSNTGTHETMPPTGTTGIESKSGQVLPDPKPPVNDGTIPNPMPMITPQETATQVHTLQAQGTTYLTQLRDKEKPAANEAGVSQAQITEMRQKRCESLQTMLNKQIGKFSQNAQSHLETFNAVYTKVQSYAGNAKVSTATYSSLVATANTQQAAATQAVDALKSVAVTVNCSEADPASSLTTIKEAVDSTRTALQGYQKAIAAVISNLEANGKQQ